MAQTPSSWLRFAALLIVFSSGCGTFRNRANTPTAAGYNPRDLIDPPAQLQFERRANYPGMLENAARIRSESRNGSDLPRRSVLCLSGGGTYGAYSAGIVCGWTGRGDRPEFDTVTGVSTGALIAPFAFLGSAYDGELKKFYTTLTNRDVFRIRPFRAVIGESVASNAPLARHLDEVLTPRFVAAIANEHRKGRRLYVGTTELEGRRFVIWNVGAFADRGTPEDLEKIKLILLGSAAIPGFFPPQEIPVTVDGRSFIERHIDGGASQALFFQPPYVPHEKTVDKQENSLAGTDVYAIVAGKLYADPTTIRPRLFNIAQESVNTILYAQTRGDLQRLWTVSELTGMNFHLAAIPAGFKTPESATDFDPESMAKMFNEGVRQMQAGTAWRNTPPGVERGESPLVRNGTNLNYETRGP
jgi:predicted patatin/cPLA2 family phospholipase